MKKGIAIFLSAIIILFFSNACSTVKKESLAEITFQIEDLSLTISSQTIKNAEDLELLLPDTKYPDGSFRMQPVIVFTLSDEVDSVTVYDYYMDMETLLFEKPLEKSQGNEYKYDVPHSSTSPNNPYGYNEFEERGFVFVITIANVKYAFPIRVSLDGSHI